MEQDCSYKTLEKNYESIIKDYLPKVNDTVRNHLIYNDDDNEIRFWNCIDVERAEDGILWMSINPSGKPEPKEKMPKFDKTWEEVRMHLTGNKKADRYWLRMLDNIQHVKGFCGHMDLLPIHWAGEEEMKSFMFPREDCVERQLAYDLIHESKKMIEALQPKLIIYSNATTEWLWGNGDPNFWLGYDPQPENEDTIEELKKRGVSHGRLLSNKTSLYTIQLGGRKTYLLIDYQVADSHRHDALTGEDVKNIWELVSRKI